MTNAFSKDYKPVLERDPNAEQRKRNSARGREMAIKDGRGWGTGTIPMLGTPKRPPPGPMKKR